MKKQISWPALGAVVATLISLGTIAMPAAANGCAGFEQAGTSGEPKLVESLGDLALLGTQNCLSSSYYFKQTTDITLVGAWTPYAFDFSGSYDGDGHVIKDLQVSVTGNAGFFSVIYGGEVSNLRFENASVVSTESYAGVLAGEVKNASTVSRISVEATLVKGSFTTGGLVGMTSGARSIISEVSVVATVESTDNLGGVLGQGESNSATITDVSFSGSVTGTGNFAGGIVGYGLGTIVEKAYSTGTVTGGTVARGGIVGAGYSGTLARKSFYLTGTVDSNSTIGGDATPIEQMTSQPPYFTAFWSIGESFDVLRSGTATETWFIGNGLNAGYPVLVWAYETGMFSCEPGTFSASGNKPCSGAPAGSFVATIGATEAIPCPVGRYQTATGQSSCVLAGPGSFVSSTGQAEAVLCAAGSFQDQTGQRTCIDAEPGFFTALEGSASQVECLSGTTSEAGATSCFLIPGVPGYTGPVVTSSNVVATIGSKVYLSGLNLDQVTTVSITGVSAAASCSATSCSFVLPVGLAQGTYDLILIGSHGSLSLASAITVRSVLVTSENVSLTTKRISSSTVKVYARDLVGAGKVQFYLNGKEIAWVRASDNSDPKLRFANGSSYLVRTIQLVVGQENVIEIYVDGERVESAAYAG